MFQRILVPVDGSDTSRHALQRAIDLAKEQHARLRIVHAVDAVNFGLDTEFVLNDFIEAVRKSGRDTLAQAGAMARTAGIEAETQLLEVDTPGKHIAEVLVDDAQRWQADLLVIGTHGRRGINRLLLGSIADKLLHLATMPVLLIRTQ